MSAVRIRYLYSIQEVTCFEKVRFDYDDDIINPCYDNIFKAIFAKDTPASHGAMQYLLSAILKRKLVMLTLIPNEPPVDSVNERQIRFDITCKFGNGELCNVEMTLYPDAYEPLRLEYYSSKLFISQDIRGTGKSYKDLKHTFQIAFLVNSTSFEDDGFVHNFEHYDKERGVSLGGRSHIITIEL